MKLYFVNARLFNQELFNVYLFISLSSLLEFRWLVTERTSCFRLAYKKLGNWTAPCPLLNGVGQEFLMFEFIYDLEEMHFDFSFIVFSFVNMIWCVVVDYVV